MWTHQIHPQRLISESVHQKIEPEMRSFRQDQSTRLAFRVFCWRSVSGLLYYPQKQLAKLQRWNFPFDQILSKKLKETWDDVFYHSLYNLNLIFRRIPFLWKPPLLLSHGDPKPTTEAPWKSPVWVPSAVKPTSRQQKRNPTSDGWCLPFLGPTGFLVVFSCGLGWIFWEQNKKWIWKMPGVCHKTYISGFFSLAVWSGNSMLGLVMTTESSKAHFLWPGNKISLAHQ